MRPHAIGGVAVLLALVLPLAAVAQTPPTPPTESTAPAAVSPAEETVLHCFDCHEQAKAFGGNPHAQGKAKKGEIPNAVCESCHGSGKEHMEAGGDKAKIYKPVGVEGANKTCLSCHDTNSDRAVRHTGVHANSAVVNCLTCHAIHGSDPKAVPLLVKPQLALCATCHATQVMLAKTRPYAHRLGRGGMECSSCHEPHGRPSRDSLRATSAVELPCYGCHSDKRGPFAFQHGAPAVGDCLTCHEMHGSTHPKQLKRANVWQLCLECHSPISTTPGFPISDRTLGSQPPSFHNTYFARYTNCTSCHVAVHGSNRDPQLLK